MNLVRQHSRAPLRATAAAITVLFMLASCGSQPKGSTPEPVVNLKILMTDDWAETLPFLAAVQEFEQVNPRVRVQIEKQPIRLMSQIVTSRVENGNPPDVVQWHAFAAGAQGLAEPLEDLWEKNQITREEFFPGAVADVDWSSHLYGIPLDTNALVLFYRTSDVSAAKLGVADFDSFPDLTAAAKPLTSPDGARRAIALPNSYWSTYGWIKANGGEVVQVGPDGSPTFTLNSPKVVETVQFLASLVRSGRAFPPAGANSNSDTLSLFRSGSATFFTSGSWDLATLDAPDSAGTFDVTLMPRGAEGTTQGSVMGGSSLFVPKGSKNRDLAFDFMKLLISDKYALRFAKEEGRLPVRARVYENDYFKDPKLQVFQEQIKTAYPLLLEAFPDATVAFENALTSILVDGADVSQALDAAQATAEQSQKPPPAPRS